MSACRCLMCRYDVSACVGERCPECGWLIDLAFVGLSDAEAAVKRADLAVERFAKPLQEPATSSMRRKILAVWTAWAVALLFVFLAAVVVIVWKVAGKDP